MINQYTIRSILPGKISRAVMLLAQKSGRTPLEELKAFYASPVYAKLESEETKYWWLSPEQLAEASTTTKG